MDYTIIDQTGEIRCELSGAAPWTDYDGTKHYPAIIMANVPDGGQLLEGAPPFLGWYDGTWHQRPDQPQPFMVWDVESKAWVDTRAVDAARADQWSLIQTARDAVIFGTFMWDGSTFQSDATSQQRIQGAVIMAQLAKIADQSYSVDWTLDDNTVRTLSADDVIGVGLALGSMVQTTFAKAQQLRTQLDAATTLEQVAAIVWS